MIYDILSVSQCTINYICIVSVKHKRISEYAKVHGSESVMYIESLISTMMIVIQSSVLTVSLQLIANYITE